MNELVMALTPMISLFMLIVGEGQGRLIQPTGATIGITWIALTVLGLIGLIAI